MRNLHKCLLLGLIITLSCQSRENPTYHIATYNIRFDNPRDSGNLWQDRLPHIVSLIQFHQFDLFGTQEGMKNQVEALSAETGFPFVGIGRDAAENQGEYCAIFYNANLFTVQASGTFWLSETPNTPSQGWDAALNRICTWARLADKHGQSFYVFNTHFDHVGQQAREASSHLILSQIKSINVELLPVILMGDFNVTSENDAYQAIMNTKKWKDARLSSPLRSVMPAGTFTGFNWHQDPYGIIDHIFLSEGFTLYRYGILTDNYGLKYPSDHFPVMVEVGLDK